MREFYSCKTSFGQLRYFLFSPQYKEKPSQTVFHRNMSFLPKTPISLIAVGDISYSRGVSRVIRKKNNVDYPFLEVSTYLQKADIVFGNLETPITSGPEIPDFSMIFRSDPGMEGALKKANFSILSLANNHTPNFGSQGLRDTFYYLKKEGIKYIGAGKDKYEANRPVYIIRKGMKVAFLAYNDPNVVPPSYEADVNHPGTSFMNILHMRQVIKYLKKGSKADFIIVSMHAGTEYSSEPNKLQIKFAHAAIDAGADLVIGHHPHVVQRMERYKGKFIFYSLGNFIFDQPQRKETKQGLMVKVYLAQKGLARIDLIPVFMTNFAQPELVYGYKAKEILARLKYPFSIKSVYFWDSSEKTFRESSQGEVLVKMSKNSKVNANEKVADLNNNSILEYYSLKKGRLTISEKKKIIWRSPSNWWISSFVLADSNNDGVKDINLLLWKSGDFGPSKPFWVKKNDMSVKNHFFLLDFVNGNIQQIWGSSNLSRPNCQFQVADIDNDGKNELIVLEGKYQNAGCKGNHVAVWRWDGWGFTKVWRSLEGSFSSLGISYNDGQSYIKVKQVNGGKSSQE